MDELRLISGNANLKIAHDIADNMRISLVDAVVGHFSDGETRVQINEDIRGKDCFVIQSTCPPVNEHFMELLIMIDALRRASAERITAVIPYFGYARQDRKHAGRVPITAKLVANMITAAGAERVLCVDLHAEQLQGFFDIPVDHLSAQPVIMERMRSLEPDDPVVLAPDAGSMKRVYKYARQLGFPLAMIDKQRRDDSSVEIGMIVGEIKDKDVLIIDDMISTGSSLIQAVKTAWENGAKSVYAYATHPVFSGRALERMKDMLVGELGVTDSIPLRKAPVGVKMKILTLAPLLAEAIRKIHLNQSISAILEKRMTRLMKKKPSEKPDVQVGGQAAPEKKKKTDVH